MTGRVLLGVSEDIAHITLDDPAKLNAITMAMAEQLLGAFEVAQSSARAIILSGSGRAFCSGANLTAGAGTGNIGPDAAAPLITHFDPVIAAIRDLQVPLVTKVRGPAAGYGASLALAGDIIVASESAFFQQAFGRIGLVPDGGSAYTLVKAIGRVRASRMMLLGERIIARQALEWGLISHLVGDDELDAVAVSIATQFASGPTLALGRTRQMAWAACTGNMDDAFSLEVSNQKDMLKTRDHQTALAAFTEKRMPIFEGR